MPYYPVTSSTFTARSPGGGGGTFVPEGPLLRIGPKSRKKNPYKEWSHGIYAARIFVGFNVGPKQVYELQDLIDIAEKTLKRWSASATFLAQRGVYTHREGKTIQEASAQIIILNDQGWEPKVFIRRAKSLAETIRRKMKQETVIVEIQLDGITQSIGAAIAPKAPKKTKKKAAKKRAKKKART